MFSLNVIIRFSVKCKERYTVDVEDFLKLLFRQGEYIDISIGVTLGISTMAGEFSVIILISGSPPNFACNIKRNLEQLN